MPHCGPLPQCQAGLWQPHVNREHAGCGHRWAHGQSAHCGASADSSSMAETRHKLRGIGPQGKASALLHQTLHGTTRNRVLTGQACGAADDHGIDGESLCGVVGKAYRWVPQLHKDEAVIRRHLDQATSGEWNRGKLSRADGGAKICRSGW
jgi:hypothetical protein